MRGWRAAHLPPAEWVVADRPLLDLEQWDLRMIYSDGF